MKRFLTLYAPEGDAGGGGGSTLLSGDAPVAPVAASPEVAASDAQKAAVGSATPWDHRSALDDTGAFKADWTTNLPDDLKAHAGTLGKYTNLKDALAAIGTSQSRIGQLQQQIGQKMRPPGPDATPEQKAEWKKLLGVPEKPDGYGLQKPEKIPEGAEWSEEQAKEFSALAHELDLTPAQVQRLAAYDLERSGKMGLAGKSKIESFIKEQKTALEKEWGDKLGENVERAKAAAVKLGLDPTDPELGNSAKFIRAMHEAAKLMKEDQYIGGDKMGQGLTGEDAVKDIMTNPNNAWNKAFMGEEGKERQQQAVDNIKRLRGQK